MFEGDFIWPIPEVGMASLHNIPDLIFSLWTVTNRSRSDRLCSCHLPRAWNISCMTTPLDSHPPPMEMFCLPPIRPMLEKHLRRGGEGRGGEGRGGEGRGGEGRGGEGRGGEGRGGEGRGGEGRGGGGEEEGEEVKGGLYRCMHHSM